MDRAPWSASCTVSCAPLPTLCSRSLIIFRPIYPVYGTAVPMHARDPTLFQHQGIGTLLMEEAERIAREEHGSRKLAVISGIGVRSYCTLNQGEGGSRNRCSLTILAINRRPPRLQARRSLHDVRLT